MLRAPGWPPGSVQGATSSRNSSEVPAVLGWGTAGSTDTTSVSRLPPETPSGASVTVTDPSSGTWAVVFATPPEPLPPEGVAPAGVSVAVTTAGPSTTAPQLVTVTVACNVPVGGRTAGVPPGTAETGAVHPSPNVPPIPVWPTGGGAWSTEPGGTTGEGAIPTAVTTTEGTGA